MSSLRYHHDTLWMEEISLVELAQQVQTPCYVYSQHDLKAQYHAFANSFNDYPHTLCYAVKANSNLSILRILAQLGAGFDIVSEGELQRVLLAQGQANNIVFSGVGKQEHEIKAALVAGIRCFNVESESELFKINQIAQHLNIKAPIALRVNPDVDSQSHPYIATGLKDNKFGIDANQAVALYQKAAQLQHIRIEGIGCHIGSQITNLDPLKLAASRLVRIIDELKHHQIRLKFMDLGGGLGIPYRDEITATPQDYVEALLPLCKPTELELIIEPGRAIVAQMGILLSKVLYLKETEHKRFCIIDAAMNDLIRPALYQAWHQILPVKRQGTATAKTYDVVGPVCESSDFLGKDRNLAVAEGDYLAILDAGAYGFSLSSNYNTRLRAAEILVNRDQYQVVRARERYSDLFHLETLG